MQTALRRLQDGKALRLIYFHIIRKRPDVTPDFIERILRTRSGQPVYASVDVISFAVPSDAFTAGNFVLLIYDRVISGLLCIHAGGKTGKSGTDDYQFLLCGRTYRRSHNSNPPLES